MKRICCLVLVLICIFMCGCQTQKFDPDSTLPPLTDAEKDTVTTEESNSVYGEIIGKISTDVLVLELDTPRMIDTWGKIVYVVTEHAADWCVGDKVDVNFTVAERPHDKKQYVRIIADELHPLLLAAKPILYFYPESEIICSAKITLNGELTCTYPEHSEEGWCDFTAYPDGTIVFPDGKEYYALYWEGVQKNEWDFSKGWCVRGEDTAEFLEWALAEQGLSAREANEFIVYWLPLMQNNVYNVISFQTTAYTDNAVLEITPTPDSLLRVFMAYYASDIEVYIEPQEFEEFERYGFTVVEWGGSQATKH